MAPDGASPQGLRPVRQLVHKTDFVRLLQAPAKERSTHFAVHYLRTVPFRPANRFVGVTAGELSTDDEQVRRQPVDNTPNAHWIGCVVPKRHARRSVTRSLLKRQIRSAFAQHAERLPNGLWLVRLRSPFVLTAFFSAASPALSDAARRELGQLLSRAVGLQLA